MKDYITHPETDIKFTVYFEVSKQDGSLQITRLYIDDKGPDLNEVISDDIKMDLIDLIDEFD